MDNRQSTANQKYSNNPLQYQEQALKNLNFDIADIYFPMFVIQLRFHIFPLRNRSYKNYQGGFGNQQNQQQQSSESKKYDDIDDDDYELYQEYLRQMYETQCKTFFILRDQYLITKVQITGTVVFLIKKEERYIFGIDDTTGVMICVLWLNDFNNQAGQSGRRQKEFRDWFAEHEVGIGTCLSVLGGMEFYKDKIQINAYKLRVIKNSNEEMLQYQQTIAAQQCYFDPFKSFQRRLFNQAIPENNEIQMQAPQPMKNQFYNNQATEVILSSFKRVKKRINDYILNNYDTLFSFTTETDTEAPQQNNNQNNESDKVIVIEDILTNEKLLSKVQDELKLCEEKEMTARQVIQECLSELEAKGFLNITGDTQQKYLTQFTKQRKNLKYQILNELKNSRQGLHFDVICRKVNQQHNNFYSKEFIFKVIDDLFQMGLILELGKHTYSVLDNQI